MNPSLRRLLHALVLLTSLFASFAVHADGSARLNLKNADIRALIATVSKVTGKNFVIDPRVKGRVTVISSQPMSAKALYQVFLSILQVHGFAAIPAGNIVKIVPQVYAKQNAVPTLSRSEPADGEEVVTQVIRVQHVTAAQLVPVLRPLVGQQAQMAAYPESNMLIVTDSAANVARIADIVRKIDVADTGDIDVMPLSHASAAEVVRILNSLEKSKAGAMTQHPVLVADERTNSILISGTKAQRLRLRGIIAHLDTPLARDKNTTVLYLQYARAKKLVKILDGVAKADVAAKQTGSEGVSIQADTESNALVITGPTSAQRQLTSIVHRLDVPRLQVLVEAIIAEISTDKARELGLQTAVTGNRSSGSTPAALTQFGGAGTAVLQLVQNPFSVGAGLTLGVGDLRSGRNNFGVLLRALQSDADTNILSTPTLVTLDNQQAKIVVAKNVPFVTGQYVNTGGGTTPSNPFQTIDRKDVGLTLKITPQINDGSSIRLAIDQEASTLAPSTDSSLGPTTNRREIKTNVMVQDGQVVVLGGLMQDSFQNNEQKVPLLGDLPVLGHLFQYGNRERVKENLMVFIHPVILRNPQMADAYSDAKYSALRASQMSAFKNSDGLGGDADSMLFPNMKDLGTRLGPSSATGKAAPPTPTAAKSARPAKSGCAAIPYLNGE